MNLNKLSLAALGLLSLSSRAARADLPGDEFRNHVVVSLGVGIGSLSPDQYNGYVDQFNSSAGSAGPLQGSAAHVGSELHVPVIITWYLPCYLLLRSGVEAAYFFPSESLASESVTNYGGILEVPIFLGGHQSFLNQRLVVELGLGPAIAAYTSAGLSGSADNGYTGHRLYGDATVGFDDELKAQYFLTPGFSLGIELGYRVLTSSQLHDGNGVQVTSNGKPLQLDMSGFRAVLEAGFVAF